MYFVDMEKISDYDLVSKTHIIDKDKQVIEQKFTKIYTPNYEKYIHVKLPNQVSESSKIVKKKDSTKKKDNALKSTSKVKNGNNTSTQKLDLSSKNNSSEKNKDCNCDCSSKDNSQDVIKKILSKNYLNFKFEKDVVDISDEQKKSILNLNYNDAKKISIVSYSDVDSLKNDVLNAPSQRAENIMKILPMDTKGKTLVENRQCNEVVEKCGTTEIRLSY